MSTPGVVIITLIGVGKSDAHVSRERHPWSKSNGSGADLRVSNLLQLNIIPVVALRTCLSELSACLLTKKRCKHVGCRSLFMYFGCRSL